MMLSLFDSSTGYSPDTGAQSHRRIGECGCFSQAPLSSTVFELLGGENSFRVFSVPLLRWCLGDVGSRPRGSKDIARVQILANVG